MSKMFLVKHFWHQKLLKAENARFHRIIGF